MVHLVTGWQIERKEWNLMRDEYIRLKIWGVAGENPARGREDIPIIGKSALPGYRVDLWFGLFASAKTPQSMLDSLNADVANVLETRTL
jgi:tripartite-type tricarboxylate transporter receptor subunit TctC